MNSPPDSSLHVTHSHVPGSAFTRAAGISALQFSQVRFSTVVMREALPLRAVSSLAPRVYGSDYFVQASSDGSMLGWPVPLTIFCSFTVQCSVAGLPSSGSGCPAARLAITVAFGSDASASTTVLPLCFTVPVMSSCLPSHFDRAATAFLTSSPTPTFVPLGPGALGSSAGAPFAEDV